MRRALLLIGVVALACSFALAQKQTRKPSSNQSQSDLKSVYQRWVDEDVAYIITPEEKRAFLLLRSDAERERFIEQFWRARDSKAGGNQNAYRAEHYRRFAHANENFGVGNVPGWKTGRGRIYITLGQPDEIRKTSVGEVWFYRHAPGFGTNVEIEFTHDSDPSKFRVLKNP
ncbi:MAG TPA: GWxTD domain-containing protein [Pyrinomonadaceae bacterium]|nr:GWxTD domain-containing protein [Pyrinomonadaceae bacterium]